MFGVLKLVTALFFIYYVRAECVPDIDCNLDVVVKTKDGGSVTCGEENNDDEYDYEDSPEIKYTSADRAKMYTLFMVDPDAPNPDKPTSKYYIHWIVNDIPGSDLLSGWTTSDQSGHVLVDYNKPAPPFGTHRYQFYLAKQESEQTFEKPSNRPGFDLKTFLNDNNKCSVVASYQYKVTKT